MPTPTYTALANITLGSSASTITFSSIPATYRDLILVANTSVSASSSRVTLNGDTGSNYSTVIMRGGAGTTVSSTSFTFTGIYPSTQVGEPAGTRSAWTIQFMDYSATDKHKTALTRFGNPDPTNGHTQAQANRWANTAAVTSITILDATYSAGSTFALYGIAS